MDLAAFDIIARGGSHGPRFIFPLLLLLLFIGLGGWFLQQRRKGAMTADPSAPMHMLQERFARGDIDQAEFEHRKAVLLGDDTVPAAPEQPVAPPPSADSAADSAEESDVVDDDE